MEVSVLSVDSLCAWRYQCYQKAVYTDGGINVISRQSIQMDVSVLSVGSLYRWSISVISRQSMHKEVSVLSVDSLYSSRYQCDQ